MPVPEQRLATSAEEAVSLSFSLSRIDASTIFASFQNIIENAFAQLARVFSLHKGSQDTRKGVSTDSPFIQHSLSAMGNSTQCQANISLIEINDFHFVC